MTEAWLSEVAWKGHTMEPPFRWGRLGTDYVGEWEGILIVRARADGSRSTVSPHPLAPKPLVEKVTSGAVAAFLRSIQGQLSMHASGVTVGTRCALLTGASGAGKSTLASLLCARYGAALLADDIARLSIDAERICVEPSEALVWLDDGSGSKAAFAPSLETRPRSLSLLVSLRFDDALGAPVIRDLRGSAMVERVLAGLLRFLPRPELWSREFEMMTLLAHQVRVIELARPTHVSANRTAEFLAQAMQLETVGAKPTTVAANDDPLIHNHEGSVR